MRLLVKIFDPALADRAIINRPFRPNQNMNIRILGAIGTLHLQARIFLLPAALGANFQTSIVF